MGSLIATEQGTRSEGFYTFITFMRFLPSMECLVFNEMGAFIWLVLSVDSQVNHWLTGLFEGLTILIRFIEALSMGPQVATRCGL